MVDVNKLEDIGLSELTRSLHNGNDLRRLLQEAFSNPEYDGKYSDIRRLLRDAASNPEYCGRYIAADMRDKTIHAFDDSDKAKEYVGGLPESLQFKTYQPILIRNSAR